MDELMNLSVALSNAVATGIMSREQAALIWKKELRIIGLVEPLPIKEAPKGGEKNVSKKD